MASGETCLQAGTGHHLADDISEAASLVVQVGQVQLKLQAFKFKSLKFKR